jgi:FtsP/CotA-like multicopper oxidase with cupredoxin domain
MKTNAYHRFHTSLLALGMILAVCFAAIRPEAAYASVLPATTCTEASGTRTCDLWATTGTLTLPGGTNVTIWGYASDGLSPAGLPGPTLVATEGETLAIVLHNGLSEATSLSIPGFLESADRVGVGAGGTKTYTYSGLQPGTYLYQAGPTANGERQIAMGLYGLLIVRPSGAPQQAYGPDSAFDDESILVMSEIDPALNAAPTSFDLQAFSPKYFLFNGKAYPDTTPIDTDAGRKVLLRVANAGLQNHSLGVLGLHYSVLSSDGRPFAHPHSAVAETLSAGQTADILVQIPADAPSGMKYAVYDSNLRLLNNGQPFGGMLTFLSIPTNPTGTDTTGPTSTGLSLSPNPSNGSVAVAFSLTVSDTDNGSNNVTAVEYFIDTAGADGTGVPMDPQDGTFDSPSETAIVSIIPTSLSAGVHTVYVHGQDAAGNWGPVNTIQLNLDKQGPVSSGLTSTPSPSNGTVSIALSGSANDSASGNSNVNAAEYFIDAAGADGSGTAMSLNQTAPIVSITGTIPSAVMNTLSEGYHTVFVHSRDALGNWGAFATLQLSVDKTGPAAGSILLRPNPNNGSLPYTPSIQSVRLDATFTEPGGGPVTSSVKNAEFFIDTVGANGTGILMTPTDGSFNSTTETGYAYIPLVTVKALSNGPHVISIHGKDAAGNWGPFSTVTLVIDKLAPTVSGVTLTPAITNNTAVAISASASDAATGNNNVSAAEYYIDTTVAAGSGAPMTVNAASPTVSLTATLSATALSALTEGTHAIYIRAKDIAGNWGDAVKANLIVDRTGPTFTGITLTPNSIVVGAASVNLTVNGSSDGATGSGVTGGEYWFGATDIAAGTGTAFSGTSAVIPTNSLAVGTYTVRVRIRDAAGNWSSGVGGVRTATLTIIPPPPLLYFSTFGNSNPPGVSGTADDADIYYFNGSAFSRVIDASGTGSLLGLSSFANVDGFDRVDATHFYLSFADAVNIPTLGTVQDEDVVYYNAGTWSLFFDGSVNGVGATDLDAISIVGGTLYFSTDNTLVPPGSGGSGDDADIYRWNGGSSYTRVFDASALGWSTANVDGFVRVDATHFYVSYSVDTTVPGLGTVQDEDVLYYNNGVWTVYFDGTGYGLTSGSLDIDAFDLP